MNLKNFIICYSLIAMSTAYSQNDIHYLENPDSQIDCSFIMSGVFLNEETNDTYTAGYSIEFRDDTVIEKMDNGKFYVKSKVVFDKNCSYVLTVIESNYEKNVFVKGLKTYAEILETSVSENLVLLRSKSKDGEWRMFVFKKI